MEKGYTVTHVSRIVEFTPSHTLFDKYIKFFMMIKIESEDYSEGAWLVTETENTRKCLTLTWTPARWALVIPGFGW